MVSTRSLVRRIPALQTPGNIEVQLRRRPRIVFAREGAEVTDTAGLDNSVWDCDRSYRTGILQAGAYSGVSHCALLSAKPLCHLATASYWRLNHDNM